jgi:hypothetical protein
MSLLIPDPKPKLQVVPPPLPRKPIQPISFPGWVLIVCTVTGLVTGTAIGSVWQIGSQIQPSPIHSPQQQP